MDRVQEASWVSRSQDMSRYNVPPKFLQSICTIVGNRVSSKSNLFQLLMHSVGKLNEWHSTCKVCPGSFLRVT